MPWVWLAPVAALAEFPPAPPPPPAAAAAPLPAAPSPFSAAAAAPPAAADSPFRFRFLSTEEPSPSWSSCAQGLQYRERRSKGACKHDRPGVPGS